MNGLWKTLFGPKLTEPESLRERVNHLETAVEGLQLQSHERQLAVLNAVEKVLHQFQARNRKREQEIVAQDAPQPTIDEQPAPLAYPQLRRKRNY